MKALNEALLVNASTSGEELAIAIRALRSIASSRSADGRSKGLAKAALRRMNLDL